MFVDLSVLTPVDRQNYLQHAVAPRPICFASSVGKNGSVNLSPFSFFNLFSTTPPILVFSPSLRIRDGSPKHTLENVREVPEVVINIVDYDMVQQTSLASCEYPRGVNEFNKAGFTEVPATRVRPPMVKESKVRMECLVRGVQSLGDQGGAGNLVLCEVLCMHIADEILDTRGMIDQQKIHHVARLGANWYAVVRPENLFLVEKPNVRCGIGMDALPPAIRSSRVLTGNHLGQLASVNEMPGIDPSFSDERLRNIIIYYSVQPEEMEKELHRYAHDLLDQGRVDAAWQVLLALP